MNRMQWMTDIGPAIVAAVMCAVFLPGIAHGAEQPDSRLALPLGRTNYFIGEKIPVAVATDGRYTITFANTDGEVAATASGDASLVRVDSSKMAEGVYTLLVDGEKTDIQIRLVPTQRKSLGGLIEEGGPGLPRSITGRHQADNYEELIQQWKEHMVKTLRQTSIDAFFKTAFGTTRMKYEDHGVDYLDLIASTGTFFFINPTNREFSFAPARVYEPEIRQYHQRLALVAQANGAYPNFAGFSYDWDGAGLFNIYGLSFYFGIRPLDEFKAYSEARDEALREEFRERTGLEPPTEWDYQRYCFGIGRPEFADALDFPEYKRLQELAKGMDVPRGEELDKLIERLDAWTHYLTGVYGEAFAGHERYLDEIMPSLKHTSSINLDHGPARLGQWVPEAYRPLDIRYMSTWSEREEGLPDYHYQWLITAAVLNIERQPDQPTWLASGAGMGYKGTHPGGFMRKGAHVLPYGGRALGFAHESFNTLISNAQPQWLWDNITEKHPDRVEDVISGRDYMYRYAPLAQECSTEHGAAVLFSRRQMARFHIHQPWWPVMHTFLALVRLGYTPALVTEDSIVHEGLEGLNSLVLANQTAPFSKKVMAEVQRFQEAGGRVFIDKASTIEVPGAQAYDQDEPYRRIGKPHKWGVSNVLGSMWHNAKIAELMPALYAALGDTGRTRMTSAQGDASMLSTLGMSGGEDVYYMSAVNEKVNGYQGNWVSHSEKLVPAAGLQGVIYDVTKEKRLGPVSAIDCSFDDLPTHLYAILPRPADRIDLRATQQITAGASLRLSARVLDEAGNHLRAALPMHIILRTPNGKVADEYYRATEASGNLAINRHIGVGAPVGQWTLTVRCMLDGTAATIPITVEAGEPVRAETLADKVTVRGGEQIKRLLASRPHFVLPVFDSDNAEELMEAARAVKKRLADIGVQVDIRRSPKTSTYTLAFMHSREEKSENARAERGETIGEITIRAKGGHYLTPMSGYYIERPTIQLDLVGAEDDSPMAAKLQPMMWPSPTPGFPAAGNAIVQIVESAFSPEDDTLVIQARDLAGLMAGAQALADLPADWLTPSVAAARTALFEQYDVGTTEPPHVERGGLTANNIKTATDRRPMGLTFPGNKPPTKITREEKQTEYYELPTDLSKKQIELPNGRKKKINEIRKLPAYYHFDGEFIKTKHPLPGDTRFFDALGVPVAVPEQDAWNISLHGVFRYWDRKPMTQASWEPLFTTWWETVSPRERKPMVVDVYVDGKKTGELKAVETGEREVYVLYAVFGDKETKMEDVVVKISGEVKLPKGKHDIKLIPRFIVEGRIERIVIDK